MYFRIKSYLAYAQLLLIDFKRTLSLRLKTNSGGQPLSKLFYFLVPKSSITQTGLDCVKKIRRRISDAWSSVSILQHWWGGGLPDRGLGPGVWEGGAEGHPGGRTHGRLPHRQGRHKELGQFVILRHVLKYISKFIVRNVQLRLVRNLSNTVCSTAQKSAKISGEENPGITYMSVAAVVSSLGKARV